MSLNDRNRPSFFTPLVGKTATFLMEGRQTNLDFSRTIAGLLAGASAPCAILDLDAFYSSNANLVLAPLSGAAKSAVIIIPAPGADIEHEFSKLFRAGQEIIIIDSLNTLYHLISSGDGSSRGRKLSFALASLSYLAKTNGKTVVLSMYRREGLARSGTSRSISGLSDVTASVDVRGRDLTVRVERGSAWPGGRISIRVP
jgi:hypothetical protein